MTQTLLLVRHGEAQGTVPGMLLGSTDAALSDAGREQCCRLRELLPVTSDTRLVSSPLARARETAAIVAAGSGAAVEVDEDLRELDFGEWERPTYEEVARDYPVLVQAWAEFAPDFAFPGGDKVGDFFARVERVADRLAAAEDETVVAFTHGGVVRSLICHFLGLPLRDYLLFDVALASVTTLRLFDGRGVLAGLQTPENPFSGPRGWVWRR